MNTPSTPGSDAVRDAIDEIRRRVPLTTCPTTENLVAQVTRCIVEGRARFVLVETGDGRSWWFEGPEGSSEESCG
jgi:hypothetical protein